MGELNDRSVSELVEAVRQLLRREASERNRDVYLIGDIEKDTARATIERLRELAGDSNRPITLYINSAGGNVTDGQAAPTDYQGHQAHRLLSRFATRTRLRINRWDCCRRAPGAQAGVP